MTVPSRGGARAEPIGGPRRSSRVGVPDGLARLPLSSAHDRGETRMPIATPDQYAEMLDRAKNGGFAYPAVNVSSSQTINAVLQGLTEAGSDGLIQVTTGGADYFAGQTVKARASGALAMAAFATEAAKNYPITVALHTDHCPKDALDGFVRPLIAASEDEGRAGRHPIFQSHMWDGSALPLEENLEIAKDLLPRMKSIGAILEI